MPDPYVYQTSANHRKFKHVGRMFGLVLVGVQVLAADLRTDEELELVW